jgi:hypothetical protein
MLTRAESRESLNEFVAGFHAEYQHSTATEGALVDAMATASSTTRPSKHSITPPALP